VLHLHLKWPSQFGAEATNRDQGLELMLTQAVGLFRIRSRVLRLKVDRLASIIRLGIEQYLGMGAPLAKDHKGRVDRNPAQPRINARSALECMKRQMRPKKSLLQSVVSIFRVLRNRSDRSV
jgi:hypothetical protein